MCARLLGLGWLVLLLTVQPARAELINLGNGMIYDTVQDLTWMQDVGYALTSGAHATGRMTQDEAYDWVESLVFGGYDDWRLPRWDGNPTSSSIHTPRSEISRLMVGLDWQWSFSPQSPGGNPHWHYVPGEAGPFNNLYSAIYLGRPIDWTGTPRPGVWWSSFYDVDLVSASERGAAWAVRDGVSRVPEPATLLIVGLGLAVIGREHRRRRRAEA